MARLFLIALGFVLAGLCHTLASAFDKLVGDTLVSSWALGCTYTIAAVVLVARLVFCWGGCGA